MPKDGIRQQYLMITVTIMIILTLVTGGIYVYAKQSWDKFITEQQVHFDKAQEFDSLADSINSLFFHTRGYYAFKIDDELEMTYLEIGRVKETIHKLRTLELTNEELAFINEIDTFLIQYEDETLPHALSLVNNDDYDGLRELSLSGLNTTINRFVDYSNRYNRQANEGLVNVVSKTTQLLNGFFLLILLLGGLLLSFTIWMVWQVLNHIIRPIEQMKVAADNYQSGHDFSFEAITGTNEIGALSDSFSQMITTIHAKEQELLSQNEELLSQQEELFDKQSKMENALSEARYARIRLERHNGLNHQLSFSLDKQELSDLVLSYFNELYGIDLGAFWLPKSGEFTLNGITEDMFGHFQKNQLDYVKLRLEKEPYFVIKREADYEKGIATTTTYVYDFITGVKDRDGHYNTAIALSRIGRAFTKEDLHDMYGLIKRVAHAVERIEQYEIINHERMLNQNILDNINEGIQFVSTTGNMEKHNHALFRLLDIPLETKECPTEKEGWIQCFMDGANDDEELRSFFETALTSQDDSISQMSYTIQGDRPKVINVYSVPVRSDSEKAGTIFVHRDITQEHEIDRMKTELVSTVSHELRTPLSSILGFTELLLSKKMETTRQKRYHETIHKEAKRLTSLINDFLDLQRMESGKQSYDMTDVGISEIAAQTIDSFPANDTHSITLVDDTHNISLYADRNRLVQVFTNILSNAMKFSPDGGNITVSLTTEDKYILTTIQDEGIGIPADQVEHIFEKFHRIDNSYSRKIGGTGLGLAICREIIEKHGGTIWIESEEHKGTTIFFLLPLKTMIEAFPYPFDKLPATVATVLDTDDGEILYADPVEDSE